LSRNWLDFKTQIVMDISKFIFDCHNLDFSPIPIDPSFGTPNITIDQESVYVPISERIDAIIDKSIEKYKPVTKQEAYMWQNERKNIFEDDEIIRYSTLLEEVDNCKLRSVGKDKLPFECFAKNFKKDVNYLRVKKPKIEENPEKKDDIVLTISLYHCEPEKSHRKYLSFFVLGSQTLDELAKAIHCLNNYSDPELKTCYFFIENCFYNYAMITKEKKDELLKEDAQLNKQIYEAEIQHIQQTERLRQLQQHQAIQAGTEIRQLKQELETMNATLLALQAKSNEVRAEIALEYSEPITWLRQKNPTTVYTTASMETTRFCDLKANPGTQYLYCHKGLCEHVLIVESVRTYHPKSDNYELFPVQCFQSKIRRKKCFICKHFIGRVVTTEDESVTENPCLYCEKCFVLLHPENEGEEPKKPYVKHPYFHFEKQQ